MATLEAFFTVFFWSTTRTQSGPWSVNCATVEEWQDWSPLTSNIVHVCFLEYDFLMIWITMFHVKTNFDKQEQKVWIILICIKSIKIQLLLMMFERKAGGVGFVYIASVPICTNCSVIYSTLLKTGGDVIRPCLDKSSRCNEVLKIFQICLSARATSVSTSFSWRTSHSAGVIQNTASESS